VNWERCQCPGIAGDAGRRLDKRCNFTLRLKSAFSRPDMLDVFASVLLGGVVGFGMVVLCMAYGSDVEIVFAVFGASASNW